MAGIFRSFGQIRRGSGSWRTPFLIPIGDIVPPGIQGSSNVAIDTGGTEPNLRIGLIPQSLDALPDIQVQFRIQPVGPAASDITLRLVLLMTGEGALVDSLPAGSEAQFAVLEFTTPPTEPFSNELQITLAQVGTTIEVDDTSLTPDPTVTIGPGTIRVDRTMLGVIDSPGAGGGSGLDVSGGIVRGPVVQLSGVETDFNWLLGTGYVEMPRMFGGPQLDWLDDPAEPTPPSVTWIDVVASGSTLSPTRLNVTIDTPTLGEHPELAPTVAAVGGGSLRDGFYRYRSTWLYHHGAESDPSPRSAPVAASGANRTVRVSGLEAAPPAPSPDPSGIRVVGRRVYRTDPDSADATDPERGDRGDDVLVAEFGPDELDVLTFDDEGPASPADEPQLRTDYLSITVKAEESLDISGSIRMISDDADDTYTASVTGAPTHARVVYRPGSEPLLSWAADRPTPSLEANIPVLSTPFGDGLDLLLGGVPTALAAHWEVLGSEYLGLAVAGAPSAHVAAALHDAVPIEQVGVRLGGLTVPELWARGEADVAVELADVTSGVAEGLVAMRRLRRAALRSGGRTWSARDADEGVIEVAAQFATLSSPRHATPDRHLRIARRAGGDDPLPTIHATAHHLSDDILVRLELPDTGPTRVRLDGRARWLRAHGTLALDDASVDADLFLDDTTDAFRAEIGAGSGSPVTVGVGWPVRLGGSMRVSRAGDAPITVWPDLIVPDTVEVETGWPITANLAEPGVSGRVAVAFGDSEPIAARTTPQVRMLQHGDAEDETGIRAVTARLLGLGAAKVPEEVTMFGDDGVVDLAPTIGFLSRPNDALRLEVAERESRISHPVDLSAPVGARTWLRARTSRLPDELSPLVSFDSGALVGGVLATEGGWGDGVVWAEPSAVWEEHTDELGTDRGIGLISTGWSSIPDHVEVWMLHAGDALDGRVPPEDRLPTVGDPASRTRDPGGAVVRVDGDLRLDWFELAVPSGDRRACRNADTPTGVGPDVATQERTPVRAGKWLKIVAPFVELRSTSGLGEAVVWMATRPEDEPADDADEPADDAVEPDPCTDSTSGPAADDAIGWRLSDGIELTHAVRMYDLVTASGEFEPAPRWWSMPTGVERWNCSLVVLSSGGTPIYTWACEVPPIGVWELQIELQMKDYGNAEVMLYPKEKTSNPYGDWDGGDGQWWLRQRGALQVPLFIAFGPEIESGDIYMGNVGGGFELPFLDGLYSTLPKIFNWSYP